MCGMFGRWTLRGLHMKGEERGIGDFFGKKAGIRRVMLRTLSWKGFEHLGLGLCYGDISGHSVIAGAVEVIGRKRDLDGLK